MPPSVPLIDQKPKAGGCGRSIEFAEDHLAQFQADLGKLPDEIIATG
jgi:hypothetical protein